MTNGVERVRERKIYIRRIELFHMLSMTAGINWKKKLRRKINLKLRWMQKILTKCGKLKIKRVSSKKLHKLAQSSFTSPLVHSTSSTSSSHHLHSPTKIFSLGLERKLFTDPSTIDTYHRQMSEFPSSKKLSSKKSTQGEWSTWE